MRSSTRLLAILFVLILSGMAIAANSTQTGDEYLEHIYVDTDELIEVMAIWSDTLNIREEAGLSARKAGTAKRGEAVIYLEPTLTSPDYETDESYFWRKCLIGDTTGWVAEDFLIEKCYFEVLEPALDLYDAGELKNMRTYLEELDRNYADINCEVASDGRSAIVAFDCEGHSHLYTNRLYLVGKPDMMVYSNYIYDYFISDDGQYSFVLYSNVSYGWGYSVAYPYTIFDNQTGEEVFSDTLVPSCLPNPDWSDDEIAPQLRHDLEVVDENHILVIAHDRFSEVTDWTDETYPCLRLIDMTNGESIILLEPDWDWLEARGEGIAGGVKLRRSSNCSSPSPIIRAAMQTELFQLCEEELVSGYYSEG